MVSWKRDADWKGAAREGIEPRSCAGSSPFRGSEAGGRSFGSCAPDCHSASRSGRCQRSTHHQSSQMNKDEGLIRAVGVQGLTAAIINYTIGAGIFVLPALVAGKVGGAAPVIYIVCAI